MYINMMLKFNFPVYFKLDQYLYLYLDLDLDLDLYLYLDLDRDLLNRYILFHFKTGHFYNIFRLNSCKSKCMYNVCLCLQHISYHNCCIHIL